MARKKLKQPLALRRYQQAVQEKRLAFLKDQGIQRVTIYAHEDFVSKLKDIASKDIEARGLSTKQEGA